MPSFGPKSQAILAQSHPDIQRVMNAAIKDFDFSVMCGTRSKEDQEKAFNECHSKAHFGQSAHNFTPSRAVDIAPHPLNWEDLNAFHNMADVVLKHAKALKVDLTWGGGWHFKDMPHFELTNWKDMP